MNEKELAEFIARLPEHLRFFFEEPPAGMDAEETIRFSRDRMAKVRRHREELIAHGIAADRFLAEAEAKVQDLEEKNTEADKAEDILLHAGGGSGGCRIRFVPAKHGNAQSHGGSQSVRSKSAGVARAVGRVGQTVPEGRRMKRGAGNAEHGKSRGSFGIPRSPFRVPRWADGDSDVQPEAVALFVEEGTDHFLGGGVFAANARQVP
jgi:hypothetical protein